MDDTTKIDFFYEDIDFLLQDESLYELWLEKLEGKLGVELKKITYIFCSDEYLLKINQEHLNHDYYTDIITFPYMQGKVIESDIFISIDRVKENAEQVSVPFNKELLRVMAHGILHLAGYGDKSQEETLEMRQMEDKCIQLF